MSKFKKLVTSVLMLSSVLIISFSQTTLAEPDMKIDLNPLTIDKVSNIQPLDIEKNMARLNGVILKVSSTYTGWEKERLIDGKLETSWFTAVNDAANLGTAPFIRLTFPEPVTVEGINFRGNREYKKGYDVLEGILVITSSAKKTVEYTVSFPPPDRDFDIKFKEKLKDIATIKFIFTRDESPDPGLAEIEVVGEK